MTPANRLVDTFNILATVVPNWPAWRKAIGEQTADGYPTGGDGARGSGPGDPVWAALQARDRIAGMMAEVEATIVELHGHAIRIDRAMKAHTPVPHDHDLEMRRAMRCADPLCDDLAVRGERAGTPLCWTHYRAWLAERPEAV